MKTTATSPSRAGLTSYTQLVRQNTNFRQLWLGQIISLLGDWFNFIATTTLITRFIDDQDGLAVGALLVVRMLAPFLISPLAGVAADRYNRKHVLILTDLLRSVTVLGFLLVRGPEHIWLLYTLTAVQLALSGFFYPARNAILPDIVQPHELGTANALSSVTWSVMLAFGAAIGGIMTGQLGTTPSFIIDAITFIGSALIIARIIYHHTPAPNSQGANVRAALDEYVEGLRYLWQHVDILVITLHKGINALLVSSIFTVLQVTLSKEVFVIGKDGNTSLGLIFTAIGIGTGVGPVAMRYFTGDRRRAQYIGIAVAYLITAVGLVISAPLSNFGLFLFGTALRGAGIGISWVFTTQLLLQFTPEHVRGRVMASENALFTLAYSIGALAGGWMVENDSMSYSGLLWGMAVVILIPGVLWTLWIINGKQKALVADGTG